MVETALSWELAPFSQNPRLEAAKVEAETTDQEGLLLNFPVHGLLICPFCLCLASSERKMVR